MADKTGAELAQDVSIVDETTGDRTVIKAASTAAAATDPSVVVGLSPNSSVSGTATTAAPTYTTGTVNPLSLTTDGALRGSVCGCTAAGVADAGNPVKVGFVGRTTLPTAVTDGQRANGISDVCGRQIINLGTVRGLRGTQTTTITSSTGETTIVTAAASTFNDLVMLIVSNTANGTSTTIDFRDTTGGTVIFSLRAPANSTNGFAIPGYAIPQTTANTNWTAQCGTSTNNIRIFAVFEKNQ